MNIFVFSILGTTVMFLLFGFLFGLKRGLNRSVLRLLLVIASGAIAFFLRNVVYDALMGMETEGGSIEDRVLAAFPPEMASLGEFLLPLVQIIVGVLIFLVCFWALKMVSWVLYLILCIAVRGERPKRRLLGGIIGLVQGFCIAFALFVPMNGLLVNMEQVSAIQTVIDPDSAESAASSLPFAGYSDSAVSRMYSKVGGFFWKNLSSVKNSKGETVVLSTQVDAVKGVADMAGCLQKLENIPFSDGLTPENADELAAVFAELGTIKDNMSYSTMEAVDRMIAAVTEGIDMPIDLSALSLKDVDFTTEGQIISDMARYADVSSPEEIDVGGVVKSLSKSTLLLPVIEQCDIEISLDEAQKDEVEQAINELDDVDYDTIERLRGIFGIIE